MKLFLKNFLSSFFFIKKRVCVKEWKIKKANFYKENNTETKEILEKHLSKILLENQNLKQKIEFLHLENLKLLEENKQIKLELNNSFQQQEKYKEELLITINQQRSIIEDKHLYISILEKKIKTLMREIKNILKIEKSFSIKEFFEKNQEATNQEIPTHYKESIKNKLNTIIKDFISCSEYYKFNLSSKDSIESSINIYSINYRCFFDKLRKDEKYIIFFYSQKENKIFFINDLFSSWIGWKSDFLFNSLSKNRNKGNNKWSNNSHIFTKKPEGLIEIQTKKRGVVSFYYLMKNILINDLYSYTIGILLPLNNKNC